MITVDYALRIYTDMVNSDEKIDMQYFQNNMSEEDFAEFQELATVINQTKSVKLTKEFRKIFEKVNNYKESLCDAPSVANFRSVHDSDNDSAKKKLDQIFDEEFNDD